MKNYNYTSSTNPETNHKPKIDLVYKRNFIFILVALLYFVISYFYYTVGDSLNGIVWFIAGIFFLIFAIISTTSKTV
jgi:hypothetical protein